jgi:hypothetical protein
LIEIKRAVSAMMLVTAIITSGSNLTFQSPERIPVQPNSSESGACELEFPSLSPRLIAFQLEALVRDRNAPQKQVWRAEIVLLSADGLRLGCASDPFPANSRRSPISCGDCRRSWSAIDSPAKTASSHGLMFHLSNI